MEYRIPTTPLKHGDEIWVHLNLLKSTKHVASWSITDRRGSKGSNPTFNKVIANTPHICLSDATPKVRGNKPGSTIDKIAAGTQGRAVTAWIEGVFTESTSIMPTLRRTVHFNPHRIKPWCYCFHFMNGNGKPTSKFHGAKLCSFNTDKSLTVEAYR